MNWQEYYGIYLGLKLHFDQPSYDYRKYGAKRVSESTLQKNFLLLKSIQGRAEHKEAFEQRLIGINRHKVKFITELYSPESERLVKQYIDEIYNWSYNLQQDLEYLTDTAMANGMKFKDMFISENEYRLPFIAQEHIKGNIKYHSFALLSELIPFCDKISPMLLNILTIEKYRQLHKIDKNKLSVIVKPYVEKLNE